MATVKERIGVGGDLSYLITISMGYKDGKQVRKNTTFIPPQNVTRNKAKKLAEQFAADYEQKHQGFVNLNENQPLSKLCEWYLATVAPTQLRATSLVLAESTISTYIQPNLGGVKLKELTPTRLDMFFADLLENGRATEYFKLKNCNALNEYRKSLLENKILNDKAIFNLKKGGKCKKETAQKLADFIGVNVSDLFVPTGEKTLSPNTVDRIRVTLSSIFSAAVKKEILTRNPILLTNTVGKKQHQQAEQFLDENQAVELVNALENCNDLMFKTAITLTLFSGCRGGEICGLKWSCVDFQHNLIYIKQQL
jgi:integrase